MIVQFDATLDDFVDVTMRSLARSKAAQSSRWRVLAVFSLFVALALFVVVPGGLIIRIGAALTAALANVVFSLATYKRSMEKRVRRICRDQNGTDGPVRIEVELSESGVRASQLGAHYIYDWSKVINIEEAEDAIFFYKSDGTLLAVRNRAFQSPAEKSEFIQLARRFTNAAAEH